MFAVNYYPFNSWRGNTESNAIVRKGIMLAIGDGEQIFFWTHRWASSKLPLKVALHLASSMDQARTVVDYWVDGRRWRWDDFADELPVDVLKRIAAIEVYPNLGIQDKPFWGETSSYSFFIQSTMRIIWGDDILIC